MQNLVCNVKCKTIVKNPESDKGCSEKIRDEKFLDFCKFHCTAISRIKKLVRRHLSHCITGATEAVQARGAMAPHIVRIQNGTLESCIRQGRLVSCRSSRRRPASVPYLIHDSINSQITEAEINNLLIVPPRFLDLPTPLSLLNHRINQMHI